MVNHMLTTFTLHTFRDHFMYAPSQWEPKLQCNIFSHWLGTCTKLSLHILNTIIVQSRYNQSLGFLIHAAVIPHLNQIFMLSDAPSDTQTCGVWLDVLKTAKLEILHLECTLIMSTTCGVNTLLIRSLMKCPHQSDLDRAYKLRSVNISPNIAVTKI